MNNTWKMIERAAESKRQRYAKLKQARTCACGTWMARAGEYHYECPQCGARRLRGTVLTRVVPRQP